MKLYQKHAAHPNLNRLDIGQLGFKQSGAVLIVSLILLLVITIVGFSSSQSVLMQEKMTYSVQEGHVALQSAELGLQEAADFIRDNVNTLAGFSEDGSAADSPGLYSRGNAPTDIFSGVNWTTSNSRSADSSVADGDVAAPRFYIEDMGATESEGGELNVRGYGAGGDPAEINVFRVVSRGVGHSEATQRVVVGYIGKRLEL